MAPWCKMPSHCPPSPPPPPPSLSISSPPLGYHTPGETVRNCCTRRTCEMLLPFLPLALCLSDIFTLQQVWKHMMMFMLFCSKIYCQNSFCYISWKKGTVFRYAYKTYIKIYSIDVQLYIVYTKYPVFILHRRVKSLGNFISTMCLRRTHSLARPYRVISRVARFDLFEAKIKKLAFF